MPPFGKAGTRSRNANPPRACPDFRRRQRPPYDPRAVANAQAAQWTFIVLNQRRAGHPSERGRRHPDFNPPYGVRLAEVQALQALYPQLGAWLKQRYAGWLAGMFTGDRDAEIPCAFPPNVKSLSGNRLPPVLMDMVKGRTDKCNKVV